MTTQEIIDGLNETRPFGLGGWMTLWNNATFVAAKRDGMTVSLTSDRAILEIKSRRVARKDISIIDTVIGDVHLEVERARGLYPPMNSLHEAYAVILEEVDEFKEQVWKKGGNRDASKIREELIQIAAMAVSTVVDCLTTPIVTGKPSSQPKSTESKHDVVNLNAVMPLLKAITDFADGYENDNARVEPCLEDMAVHESSATTTFADVRAVVEAWEAKHGRSWHKNSLS